MGCRRAISNNIAASTSVFLSSAGKFPRAARRALGPSALGHGVVPSGIFRPRTKKPRFRGYIVGYSPLTPHIHITYIYVCMYVCIYVCMYVCIYVYMYV